MSHVLAPFQLLELNVISAQDLAPAGRSMRTYAVAWVHPDRKLSTKVDTQGHANPTWNDKFVFRVDEEFLCADTSAIMVEIYALHWFKDIHVGTVRVLVGNVIQNNNRGPMGMGMGMRFVALQVRRPSGRPQGILNIGVAMLDSSMRSMPLYTHNASAVGYRHLMGERDAYENHNHIMSPKPFAAPKPELRRSKSDTSSMLGSEAMARQHQHQHQHRLQANTGKANSDITVSEVYNNSKKKKKKKEKKRRSRSRSRSRPSSVLSAASDGKAKSERASSVLKDMALLWDNPDHGHDHDHYRDVNDDTAASVLSPSEMQVDAQPPPPPPMHRENEVVHVDVSNLSASSINAISESALTVSDVTSKQPAAFAVAPSPKPHFRNSPAPHFLNSPRHFRNSPGVDSQFRNSPAVESQFRNSPAVQLFKNSPKPQFRNSPAVGSQFRNSPAVGSQFRNSPAVGSQFRNSPALSKFNPAAGYGGSHRGTPLHPFGKLSGAFDQYGTPRRSNLANVVPQVMTESELGPSPSEVAAEMAKKPVIDEGDNSTVGGWSLDESVEGLQSKLGRWRTDLPPVIDRGEYSSFPTSSSTKTSRHTRRHTDGGNGLFSCFSNICGIQCTIVCGGPKAKKNQRRRTPSVDGTSFL